MADFQFIEDTHTYRLDGQVIPSVTEVLYAEGFIDKTWYTDYGRDRGRIVHKVCHFHDVGILDEDSVDPVIVPRWEAYKKFLKETGFKVIMSEKPVYSLKYKFGAIPDKFGLLFGKHADIDLKTGTLEPWIALQTAAQVIALREYGNYGDADPGVINRFGLQLRDDGDYRLKEYKDWHDTQMFLSALACYQWKKNIKNKIITKKEGL